MAGKKDFVSWMFRYASSKAHFPEPWSTVSEDVFTSSRTISAKASAPVSVSADDIAMSTSVLPVNSVRAIHALRDGKHYVAVSGDKVLVEYHSDKGTVEVVAYSMTENTISAGILSLDEGGDIASVTPIDFESKSGPSSSSGVAAYIAMLTAAIIGNQKHSHEIASLLTDILPRKKEEDVDVSSGTIHRFVALNARFYKVMSSTGDKDSWLGSSLTGITHSGSMQRLSVEELYGMADTAVPVGTLASLDAVLLDALKLIQACNRFSSETVLFADVMPWASSTPSEPSASAKGLSLEDLRVELKLDIHKLNKTEETMVPRLGANYVVDDNLLEAARIIKRDWKCDGVDLAPNFILEGDAGSGKTAASKFFADVFGIPRTKMTMHPLFESSNLIGAFYPVFQDLNDMDLSDEDKAAIAVMERRMSVATEGEIPNDSISVLRACRRTLEEPGVIEEIAAAYDIPSWEECELDPEDAWERLGFTTPVPERSEVVKAAEKEKKSKIYRLMSVLCEKVESNSVSYRFILSELMRAFQYGWLLEVQEAASVLRPGVLTELNSLLEKNGRIELPNGKFITRHPDTIVIFTTNRDYAGNVDLNESLRDRCMMGIKMDLPPASVMAARAMMQTGFTDSTVAEQAASTIMAISEEAKARNIKGSFGMRSLIGWMRDHRNGDYSEKSFRRRVIEKMTTREDDISILMTCFRANCPFMSKTAKSGRV